MGRHGHHGHGFALNRRREYLERRLVAEADSKAASYIRAEISALNAAIRAIEDLKLVTEERDTLFRQLDATTRTIESAEKLLSKVIVERLHLQDEEIRDLDVALVLLGQRKEEIARALNPKKGPTDG